jgi:hypothetical protein
MSDNAVDFVGDAIIIHGQQNKIDFLGQVSKSSLTPVILVATSAANCGIDDGRIRYIVRNGLSFSFISFLQELGRAGRYKGATHNENYYHVVLSLTNFVNSLHMSHFFNLLKFIKANGTKMEANEIASYKKTSKFKADTAKFKELLKGQQVSELFELLRLFCLKRGCVHYILEAYAQRMVVVVVTKLIYFFASMRSISLHGLPVSMHVLHVPGDTLCTSFRFTNRMPLSG